MAAFETTRPAPLGAVSIFRAVNGVGGMFSMLSNWNDVRVTRKALNKLTDRELDDIGLCRGDVDQLGR